MGIAAAITVPGHDVFIGYRPGASPGARTVIVFYKRMNILSWYSRLVSWASNFSFL